MNRLHLTRIFFIPGLLSLACLALPPPVMAEWQQLLKTTSVPRVIGAQFGHAIAINGNTMVVGAPFDSTTGAASAGAAYVFLLSGKTWAQQATLVASDPAAGDQFGYSVAVSGNTIVVGAYHADRTTPTPVQSDSGAAYVFVRNGTTWTEQQKLTAVTGDADDEFGNAVAVAGNSLVVGAHAAGIPMISSAGSAYLFRRTGTIWAHTQTLIPNGGLELGDLFGGSVAMSGSTLVVGSPGADIPETRAGAVYVFAANSTGMYSLQQKLTIPDGTNGDNFGCSVALDGNTIVAGAREDAPITAPMGQTAYGAAYVFGFNGTWTQRAKLTAADGAATDRFGWSVAVNYDIVAVGARGDDTGLLADTGSAYLFTRNGGTWTSLRKLAPADVANNDRFGVSVALSVGNLVVGAAEKALTMPNGQGAVYYYRPVGEVFLAGFGWILLTILIATVLYGVTIGRAQKVVKTTA
jgi:hypothetical protein